MLRSIDEIRSDRGLQVYGLALAGTGILTALWAWPLVAGIATEKTPICWPFLQNCLAYRDWLNDTALRTLVIGLAGLSALAGYLFWRGRVGAGWVGLAGAAILQLAFVLIDFRLRRNQHIMSLSVIAVFLFYPNKRDGLRLLIASFYFWAGLLKLNGEWLSGATLYKPLWFFEGKTLVLACAYVVVLETLLVWGLFSKRLPVFVATLGQLLLFHLFSYPVVGFFYPALMLLLLAIFPLSALGEANTQTRGISWKPDEFGSRLRSGGVARSTLALFLIFALFQVGPRSLPGDTALTGEGRFLSLHMFDSLAVCRPQIWLRTADGSRFPISEPTLAPRIHCDPWVLLSRARVLCRDLGRLAPLHVDVDMELQTQRNNEVAFQLLVEQRGVCGNPPTYRWWGHNPWIETIP